MNKCVIKNEFLKSWEPNIRLEYATKIFHHIHNKGNYRKQDI